MTRQDHPQTDPGAGAGVVAARLGVTRPGVTTQPREHSVPCRYCRRPTWREDALCERHMGRPARYRWYTESDTGAEVVECNLCGVYVSSYIMSELARWSGVEHPAVCAGAAR